MSVSHVTRIPHHVIPKKPRGDGLERHGATTLGPILHALRRLSPSSISVLRLPFISSPVLHFYCSNELVYMHCTYQPNLEFPVFLPGRNKYQEFPAYYSTGAVAFILFNCLLMFDFMILSASAIGIVSLRIPQLSSYHHIAFQYYQHIALIVPDLIMFLSLVSQLPASPLGSRITFCPPSKPGNHLCTCQTCPSGLFPRALACAQYLCGRHVHDYNVSFPHCFCTCLKAHVI